MTRDTDTSAEDRRDLPDSEVHAQLERILASPVFSRSQPLRRFLSFIVEQRLAGQAHTLKESVLAHELYGKGTGFDGGTDPVVRVDARRLRDKLREYYDGRSEPILISLPKGSYVPVFERQFDAPAPVARLVALPPPREERSPADAGRTRMRLGALALVAVLVAGVVAWWTFRGTAGAPAVLL